MTAPRRASPREWFRRAGLAIGGLAVFFLAAHVAGLWLPPVEPPFRVPDRMPWVFSNSPLYEIQNDDGGPWVVPRANTILFDQVNPKRFRPNKARGTFRIFCIGQSTTEGSPFHPRGSYPEWLRVYLKRLLPDSPTEVINAGVRGSDSTRDLLILKEVVTFDPDLVVLYEGNNEVETSAYRFGIGRLGPWGIRLHFGLLKHSNAYRFFYKQLADQGTHLSSVQIFEKYERNLREMLHLARKHSARVVLVSQLTTRAVEEKTSEENDILRQLEGEHVAYTDAFPLFEDFLAKDVPLMPGLFVDFVHPSLQGHSLIAQAVCRTLSRREWIASEIEWKWNRIGPYTSYFGSMGLDDDFLGTAYFQAACHIAVERERLGNNRELATFIERSESLISSFLKEAERLRPGMIQSMVSRPPTHALPVKVVELANEMKR